MLGPLGGLQGTSPNRSVPTDSLRYALWFLYRKQLFWLALLEIFKISTCFQLLVFIRIVEFIFDFCNIPLPLAFLFIILDFKVCFFQYKSFNVVQIIQHS